MTSNKVKGTKVRMDLIRPEQSVALAAVLQHGAAKYSDNNYLDEEPRNIKAALLRHGALIEMGEANDPDSGFPHSWHVLACAAVLVSLEANRQGQIQDLLIDCVKGQVEPGRGVGLKEILDRSRR